MARNIKTLAIAIFALVILLPVRAQNSSSVVPVGVSVGGTNPSRPGHEPIGTTRLIAPIIDGARVGIEPDGSSWQTILWIVNAYGGDMNPFTVSFFDENGKSFHVSWTTAGDIFLPSGFWVSGQLCANAAERAVLGGSQRTATAQSFSIQLQTNGGIIISAILQHLDSNGMLLDPPVALRERGTKASTAGSKFAVGLDVETGLETVLTFSNPGLYPANVTLAAFGPDGIGTPGRTPFATVQIVIPPGISTRTVSDVFSTSEDYARGLNTFGSPTSFGGYIDQGFLSIVTDQPTVLGVVQETIDTATGDFYQTIWQAFPGAPPSLGNQ